MAYGSLWLPAIGLYTFEQGGPLDDNFNPDKQQAFLKIDASLYKAKHHWLLIVSIMGHRLTAELILLMDYLAHHITWRAIFTQSIPLSGSYW